MSHNRSLRTVIGVLLVVIFAQGTWAQGNYKTIFKFSGGNSGTGPFGLIFDQQGNLYGPVEDGDGLGAVFKLTHKAGGWTKSLLYRFANDDGLIDAGLIFDKAGNLYGTTSTGGTAESGTVFELMEKPNGGWAKKVLYNFCSLKNCADGAASEGGLIFDKRGSLYGTTIYGGARSAGTVFKLSPNSDGSWTESVLHSFNISDGSSPIGGLVFDPAGNLYGTTIFGGHNICKGLSCGVVFQLTPHSDGSWTSKVIYHFQPGKNGGQPSSTLVLDGTGNLYGTTTLGGNSGCGRGFGCGVAFKLSQSLDGSWKEKTLSSFAGKGGEVPFGGLIFDQSGNLYGKTTWGGDLSGCNGNGCGVVFKLTSDGDGAWKETVLHAFHNHPGANPSGLIFDTAGTLYGTSGGDGTTTFGSVFKIMP